MLTYREGRRASVRIAALVVMAAGVAALAPQGASAASMYVHSAGSGELTGNRLVLRNVGRNVTWTSHRGDAGLMRITRMHRLLFAPGATPVAGTLHIAGQRGGQELALRVSRPRYNAARQTVSYRVKRLRKRSLRASAAAAAPAGSARRFGAASLSLVAAGAACSGQVTNRTGYPLLLTFTDPGDPGATWALSPGTPQKTTLADGDSVAFTTVGDYRCEYDVTYQVTPWKAEFRLDGTTPDLHEPPKFTCQYLNGIPPPGPLLKCTGSDGNWVLEPS
jgi:hypothetical protein